MSLMNSSRVFLLLAIAVSSSCKSAQRDSQLKDLNPTELNSREAFSREEYLRSRRPVLVYYWNQTNINAFNPEDLAKYESLPNGGIKLTQSSKSYIHLLRALSHSNSYKKMPNEDQKVLDLIRDKLLDESDKFTGTWSVGANHDFLFRHVSSMVNWASFFVEPTHASEPPAVICFFNLPPEDQQARFGYFYTDAGDFSRMQVVKVTGKIAENFPFNEHPLATQDGFRQMLQVLSAVYPPEKSRYTMIIKSHGDADSPLALKFPIDLRSRSLDEIAVGMLKHYKPRFAAPTVAVNVKPTEGKDFSDPTEGKDFSDPTEGKDFSDPTEGKDFSDPTGGKGLFDPLSTVEGVQGSAIDGYFNHKFTKVNLLKTLSEEFRPGHFPIIVFESCHSELTKVQTSTIRENFAAPNIGTVYGSSGGLQYEDNIGGMDLYRQPGADIQLKMQHLLDSKARPK